MKKTVFLISSLLLLLITGCNEKNLVSNITGNWHVERYTENGTDRTQWFDTTYLAFKISFTSDMKYSKSWQIHRIGGVYSSDTTSHYDTITHTTVIDGITTTSAIVPFISTNILTGDWLLTNGNHYLETRDTASNTLYQIVDHSKSSLHLATGNQDYYLSK